MRARPRFGLARIRMSAFLFQSLSLCPLSVCPSICLLSVALQFHPASSQIPGILDKNLLKSWNHPLAGLGPIRDQKHRKRLSMQGLAAHRGYDGTLMHRLPADAQAHSHTAAPTCCRHTDAPIHRIRVNAPMHRYTGFLWKHRDPDAPNYIAALGSRRHNNTPNSRGRIDTPIHYTPVSRRHTETPKYRILVDVPIHRYTDTSWMH